MSKSPTLTLVPEPRDFTPEEVEEIVREITRPKLLQIEVHWRTLKAAKANPGSLRIIVEAEDGTKIVERPFRPRDRRTECEGHRTDFDAFMVRWMEVK
jgi:hypothetical protein